VEEGRVVSDGERVELVLRRRKKEWEE